MVSDSALWADFLFLYFVNQFPVFAMGILLFFIIKYPEQHVSSSTLLLASVLLIFNFINGQLFILPQHILFSIVFVSVALALSRRPVRILVNPLVSYIGEVSFSMYLVHFAVLFALESTGYTNLFIPSPLRGALVDFSLRYIIVVAVSVLLASFLYRIVEIPLQNVGKRLIIYMKFND